MAVNCMESNCVFGIFCPSHGLQCGCDLSWINYDSTEELSWGIDIYPNGRCIYFCFDRHNRMWFMCREHFVNGSNYTEDMIELLIQVGLNRILLTPEE